MEEKKEYVKETVRIKEEDMSKGFVSQEYIDMKIYRVPIEVSNWFKKWCDTQGFKFNVGMVQLMKLAEGTKKDETVFNAINGLTLKLDIIDQQIAELYKKSEEPKPVGKKLPATFGTNVRNTN